MGRIKTSQVKNAGVEIFDKYRDKFSGDFSKNKQFLRDNYTVSSKKLLNVITGYITKLKKQSERI
ncbi:MAG: 30S ribosomal protein S17e [Candidatus Aenigmarchaeota archaeon]|nr:30S ribosomal protein S17e [Candidatus Aenigmarchaeota archaeon]